MDQLIEHADTFSLFAEVAIAVAGFAGVATVFGGREKRFRDAELLRLRGLFQLSALVLSGCFGIASCQAAGLSNELTMILVSMTLIVAYGLVAMDAPVKATRLYREKKETTISLGALAGAWSIYVFGLPLLTINAFLLQQEWPLILLFSLSILQSIWQFYRLVTKVN